MTTQPFDMSITEMVLTLVRFGLLLFIISSMLVGLLYIATRVLDVILNLVNRFLQGRVGDIILVAVAVYVAIRTIAPMLSKSWWEAINVFK